MTWHTRSRRIVPAVAFAAGLLPAAQSQEPGPTASSASGHHAHGVEFHNARRLDDASREYARAMSLDPPRAPTAAELTVIKRFAPRLHTTATEIFPLKDAAAVLHPTERLIAYHLFWEDDIDFPDDNDPCDHEVVLGAVRARRRIDRAALDVLPRAPARGR